MRRPIRLPLPLLLLAAFVIAGCGQVTSKDSPTSGSSDPNPVVTPATSAPDETTGESDPIVNPAPLKSIEVVFTGGCMMAGPNCPRWVVTPDGSLGLFRVDATEPETTGTIDQGLWQAVADEWSGVNPQRLHDSLDPGTCNGCVDGIDTVVVFHGENAAFTFDSTEVEFDPSHPLFSAMDDLVVALQETTALEVQMR